MDSPVNLALFVQMINFGVAYVILSRVVVKPALKLIFAQEAADAAREQELHRLQAEMGARKLEQEELAVQLRSQAQKFIPPSGKPVQPSIHIDELKQSCLPGVRDTRAFAELIESSAQKLAERIERHG